ncbi:methyl-accepting chemotaxis protein [Candidatus Magnetominusculus dajiuhuensis]|uniref:methyl-accepting chemotaxis protein n=1 Tax=Candidatus Magnetominusculus dajiuhuensis TaxID=3137712 RepID=UPI003B4334AC
MLNNIKIGARLYILAGFSCVLLVVIGLFGLNSTLSTHALLKDSYEHEMVASGEIGIIYRNFERARINLVQMLMVQTKEEIDKRVPMIESGIAENDERWKKYSSLKLSNDEKRISDTLHQDRLAYINEGLTPVMNAVRGGKYDEAKAIFDGKFRPLAKTMEKDYDELIQLQLTGAKNEYEKSERNVASTKTLLVALILIGVICLLAAAITIIKSITKPLSEGVGAMHRIASGDLTVDIQSFNTDEAGQLLSAMAEMAANLNEMIEKIKQSADMVAASSDGLKSSSEQMSLGVNEQSSKSSQIATSATEMSQTVVDIARNASSIATSAVDTAREAKEGEAIVNKSINEVKGIAQTVGESAGLISSLGERSKQIGDIVKVIKDIADQTNLLALNAAIEAARAGEQGRGFAVVADEVRKLAERTAKATSEISTMIISIQDETDMAVSSMDGATKMVEAGVENVSSAGESLHKIVASIQSLQVMVEQIASATEEMSTVSETITTDIESIANVSQETSASSDHIARSASELSDLSSGLQHIVGQFKVSGAIGYSGGGKRPLKLQ